MASVKYQPWLQPGLESAVLVMGGGLSAAPVVEKDFGEPDLGFEKQLYMDGDDDPLSFPELNPVRLEDKPTFDFYFSQCPQLLSDYTFANTYIWRKAVRIGWRVLHDCLCIFANGYDGLSMLCPPIGDGDTRAALRRAMQICDEYDRATGATERPYIEYVSQDMLGRLPGNCRRERMSGDYVYLTSSMISLEGGDLASKRQAKNRFARRYAARTEPFTPAHAEECIKLLGLWHQQHDASDAPRSRTVQIKQAEEEDATIEAIRHADELNFKGMVLYADDKLVGFTFGEQLGPDTCSIVIEKADRNYTGSAQYIFSEFCRQYWSHTKWCNVGDDWEVPSLAFTKNSYRPAMRLDKWRVWPVRRRTAAARPAAAPPPAAVATRQMYVSDMAGRSDIDQLASLEERCFADPLPLKKRQLSSLLRSPTANVHVIRHDDKVVAEAVVLRRKTVRGTVGRIYSLGVDAEKRGCGLGKQILKEAVETLQKQGVQSVLLEVDVENSSAIALYQKAGFKIVRRLADYYAPGKDGWKMRLDLNQGATVPVVALTQAAATDNLRVRE